MKKLLIYIVLLFSSNFLFGQGNFKFKMFEQAPSSLYFVQYEFDGVNLIVCQQNLSPMHENERFDTLQTRKLNQNEIIKVYEVCKNIGLDSLNEKYSRPVIDGTHRIFEFFIDGKNHTIRLENYYLRNLDLFIHSVNEMLDAENRVISFGEDLLNSPDTVIFYLPAFLLDTLGIPKQYKSSNEYCFKSKAGGGPIYDIDSIKYCECRIYPKRTISKFKKQNLWEAERIGDFQWKKRKYNFENKEWEIEYLTDSFPYVITYEKRYSTKGTKPSTTIYKYYKSTPEKNYR